MGKLGRIWYDGRLQLWRGEALHGLLRTHSHTPAAVYAILLSMYYRERSTRALQREACHGL